MGSTRSKIAPALPLVVGLLAGATAVFPSPSPAAEQPVRQPAPTTMIIVSSTVRWSPSTLLDSVFGSRTVRSTAPPHCAIARPVNPPKIALALVALLVIGMAAYIIRNQVERRKHL